MRTPPVSPRFLALSTLLLLCGAPAASQGLSVTAEQKLSALAGGLVGTLDDGDFFGCALAGLGDLDGDGVGDLAAGARGDDDGGTTSFLFTRGALWILFLNDDGTIAGEQKISATSGGFGGTIDEGDEFGCAVTALGDLDGDGVVDLAVGARNDDDGGASATANRGAVWILLMNADGTVKAQQKISATAGGFAGVLDDGDQFGGALAGLGDLDGDGTPDLAVGAVGDDDGGAGRGAVWILFLEQDGTVTSSAKLASGAGGMAALDDGDAFGSALTSLADLDGDTVPELAVGALADDDGGGGLLADRGAVWVLFLTSSGAADATAKISATAGGFGGTLDNGDNFGAALGTLGDFDGDGLADLAVGADRDDDGGPNRGAAWVIFLNADASVKEEAKVSATAGSFSGALDDNDVFGAGLIGMDIADDGSPELFAGARLDDDGGSARGAIWGMTLFPASGDATAVVYNGKGTNPVAYTSLADPILGSDWPSSVDLAGGTASIIAISANGHLPITLTLSGFVNGEVLCLPPFTTFSAAGAHVVSLPAIPALVGVQLCAQGSRLSAGSLTLLNALDLTLGTF
jgi:hypothetical protein